MDPKQTIEQAQRVKARYEQDLMKLPNVVGVGIGFKYENGQTTETIALIVSVTHKETLNDLAWSDIIPTELEGIPVDVQEVGEFKAL